MKIKIEDREYTVSQLVTMQSLDFLEKKILEIYNSAPSIVQAAFMVIVRHELAQAEKRSPDKKDILRPPKRKDPVEHVLSLVKLALVDIVPNQVVEAKINADGEIIAIELEGASTSGGPVAVSRDEWKW